MRVSGSLKKVFLHRAYRVINFRDSLAFRYIRVKFFNRPIRVWFYRQQDFTNFGDELIVDIVKVLFNREVERVEVADADLFGVGSIIEIANTTRYKKAYVWGSGFIKQGGDVENDSLIFKAVRGYNSKSRLPQRYGSIAIGDPGLLSSLVYKKSDKRSGKIGIIPHYVDVGNVLLEDAKLQPDKYKIISVKDSPRSVVSSITECDIILSSSLHGLIVADSFNIPNIHMPLSDLLTGGRYKFLDYYSSTSREYKFLDPIYMYDDMKLRRVIDEFVAIDNLSDIQGRLIKSFPYR